MGKSVFSYFGISDNLFPNTLLGFKIPFSSRVSLKFTKLLRSSVKILDGSNVVASR